MTSEASDRERSFKVQDRRRFSETGEAREGVAETEQPEAKPAPADSPIAAPSAPTAEEAAEEITFATFVLSLSTQALAHLGEIPQPVDGMTHVDLVAARQIIDILGMLQEKTKGNLDPGEAPLLDGVLYDLRMKFVERARPR